MLPSEDNKYIILLIITTYKQISQAVRFGLSAEDPSNSKVHYVYVVGFGLSQGFVPAVLYI